MSTKFKRPVVGRRVHDVWLRWGMQYSYFDIAEMWKEKINTSTRIGSSRWFWLSANIFLSLSSNLRSMDSFSENIWIKFAFFHEELLPTNDSNVLWFPLHVHCTRSEKTFLFSLWMLKFVFKVLNLLRDNRNKL